jgi:hypothetical protein
MQENTPGWPKQRTERPLPSDEAVRRRERIFIPVAVLLAAISALAIYWFATWETTAIATVPPAGKPGRGVHPAYADADRLTTVDNNRWARRSHIPSRGKSNATRATRLAA